MPDVPSSSDKRFPWGYALATPLPLLFFAGMWASCEFLDSEQCMAPAMLCSMLIGPSALVLVGWGAYRLWKGDGKRFPALRWLMVIQLIVAVLGFDLS